MGLENFAKRFTDKIIPQTIFVCDNNGNIMNFNIDFVVSVVCNAFT